MKQKSRFAKIEFDDPGQDSNHMGNDGIKKKQMAVIDERTGDAMVRLGNSLAFIAKEDYKELTDAPFGHSTGKDNASGRR